MKRTQDQQDFDLAKHGWAFSNAQMLEGKVRRCEVIAQRLSWNDLRHDELVSMREALAKEKNDV